MIIYALNIISHWLLMIGAVTATSLVGYAINRARYRKDYTRAEKISLKNPHE